MLHLFFKRSVKPFTSDASNALRIVTRRAETLHFKVVRGALASKACPALLAGNAHNCEKALEIINSITHSLNFSLTIDPNTAYIAAILKFYKLTFYDIV